MKRLYPILMLFALISGAACTRIQSSVPARIKDGVITLKSPARQPGQTSALQLTAEPLSKVRTAFIGLGMRGPGAVRRFTFIEGAEIKALCDLEQSNVNLSSAAAFLQSVVGCITIVVANLIVKKVDPEAGLF